MKFILLLALATVLRPLRAVAKVVHHAAETTDAAVRDTAYDVGVKAVEDRIKRAERVARDLADAEIAARSVADGLKRARSDDRAKVASKAYS